ncbi:hypothetical protein [Streptosporangium roseum]|uniref:hypothetical protein n=1 Tax=Streptosporangium roseum TaxID=2001 RepID=UPI0033288CB5
MRSESGGFVLLAGRRGCRIAALGVMVVSLSACGVMAMGAPESRPIGIGLARDGRLQYFAPLCPGERVASAQVTDYETANALWQATRPNKSIRQGGRITVGESSEFERPEVSTSSPLPELLSVGLTFADGQNLGARVDLREVPQEIAGTDLVMGYEGKKTPEKDFRARVQSEFC